MCHSAGKFMAFVFLDAEDVIHVALISRGTDLTATRSNKCVSVSGTSVLSISCKV